MSNLIQLCDKKLPIVMNASGCWVTSPQQIENISKVQNMCVVSKTCTLNPRNANPAPNFIEFGQLSINSKGLPNLGYIVYRNLWRDFFLKGGTLIMSFDCSNFGDLIIMLQDFDHFIEIVKAEQAIERGFGTPDSSRELVELNVSCPNKLNNGGRIIGYDLKHLEKILNYIRGLNLRNMDIGVKLPPYLDKHEVDCVGGLLMNYQDVVKYVVCCNSVPNAMPFLASDAQGDIPKRALLSGVGGMSGIGAKFIALANVCQLGKILADCSIKIIGCGGIETTDDVKAFLSVGAIAVQIGRALYINGIEKITELNESLSKIEKVKSKL